MPQPTEQQPIKPKRITETQLKQRIYRVLDDHFPEAYRRKLSDRFAAGVLDLYILYKGKSVWLELKVWPNVLTALQVRELQKIQAAGGAAYSLTYVSKDGTYQIWGLVYTDLLTLLKEVLL
jgi:hypothetical protein